MAGIKYKLVWYLQSLIIISSLPFQVHYITALNTLCDVAKLTYCLLLPELAMSFSLYPHLKAHLK